MIFKKGDVLRDADNYVGLFRHHNPDLGVFMTVRAADTGAEIPRRAKPPVTLVASARPACLTCRHWVAPERIGERIGEGIVENITPDNALAGVCRAISVDLPGTVGPYNGLAFAQNKRDASSCLRTRPSFGCVLHETVSDDEPLEFDAVTRTESMRSVRRSISLSNGESELAVVSFRRAMTNEWSPPRLHTPKTIELSQEDLALVTAVTTELYNAYDRAFGKKR